MSSLHEILLAQPSLQTRQALILLGLQNDFISRDGKLPVHDVGYVDRIAQLVPAFREFGDIIWVRTEYEHNLPANEFESARDTIIVGDAVDDHEELLSFEGNGTNLGEDDEELFLVRTASREPCCVRGTKGAEFTSQIKSLIKAGKDLHVIKTHYSAFKGTSLLLTLRSKLITELFVGGSVTNLSLYATAMDAARYGIRITLIEDCLGYRKKNRHDLAIKRLHDIMEAEILPYADVLNMLRDPVMDEDYNDAEDEKGIGIPHCESATASKADDVEVDSEVSEDEATATISFRRRKPEQSAGLCATINAGQEFPNTAPNHADLPSAIMMRAGSFDSGEHGDVAIEAAEVTSENDCFEFSQTKVDIDASHNGKLDILDAPDSSPCYQPSWLDLLPSRSALQYNSAALSTDRGLAGLPKVAGLDPSTAVEYEVMMQRVQKENAIHARSRPLFGEDKEAESGQSKFLCELLPEDVANTIFVELKAEVNWQTMYHQTGEVPRLVCCQGTIDDGGSMPVYRHPSDQTIPLESWSPAVNRVRKAAEMAVGHTLNHALIQLYRSGNDYISEHSDKTLDIVKGSKIVNVSFGAQRTMRLRTKRSVPSWLPESSPTARTTHRILMSHNSMLIMSLPTNAQYLHGIHWDRRPACELVEAEKAYGGQRISLTFRHIGTFLDRTSTTIWGQGATGKTKGAAQAVVNGDLEQSEKLVRAFGMENQASTIVWEKIYGKGFDVLHLKS